MLPNDILKDDELKLMCITRCKKYNNVSAEWDSLQHDFLSLLRLENHPNYHVGVDTCATNIIHNIFYYYMVRMKDCVIITSNAEHPSVLQQFTDTELKGNRDGIDYSIRATNSSMNKVHMFDMDNIATLDNLRDIIKSVKTIFLYTRGCESQDGKIYTDDYMLQIREKILNINKNVCIKHCIDDVQSLFIINRDYSLYDYIIGTAHALVPQYDTGIIIYNDEEQDFGYQITRWLKDYLNMYNIVKKVVVMLRQVKQQILSQITSELPPDVTVNIDTDTITYNPNIICITFPIKYYKPTLRYIKDKLQNKYNIKLEGFGIDSEKSFNIFIRIRCIELLSQKIALDEVILHVKSLINVITSAT